MAYCQLRRFYHGVTLDEFKRLRVNQMLRMLSVADAIEAREHLSLVDRLSLLTPVSKDRKQQRVRDTRKLVKAARVHPLVVVPPAVEKAKHDASWDRLRAMGGWFGKRAKAEA